MIITLNKLAILVALATGSFFLGVYLAQAGF